MLQSKRKCLPTFQKKIKNNIKWKRKRNQIISFVNLFKIHKHKHTLARLYAFYFIDNIISKSNRRWCSAKLVFFLLSFLYFFMRNANECEPVNTNKKKHPILINRLAFCLLGIYIRFNSLLLTLQKKFLFPVVNKN